MMFGGFGQEQPDPTSADIGKFLPEADLLANGEMQARYPQVFASDDKLFGGQHPQGTKLMCYFDDDPNKPIRLEVLGSRWMIEFGDKSPVYIVRYKGTNGLSQIHLTSAHDEAGWKVGWDLPPPGN